MRIGKLLFAGDRMERWQSGVWYVWQLHCALVFIRRSFAPRGRSMWPFCGVAKRHSSNNDHRLQKEQYILWICLQLAHRNSSRFQESQEKHILHCTLCAFHLNIFRHIKTWYSVTSCGFHSMVALFVRDEGYEAEWQLSLLCTLQLCTYSKPLALGIASSEWALLLSNAPCQGWQCSEKTALSRLPTFLLGSKNRGDLSTVLYHNLHCTLLDSLDLKAEVGTELSPLPSMAAVQCKKPTHRGHPCSNSSKFWEWETDLSCL